MTRTEIMAALEAGKKIRGKRWDKGQYLHLIDNVVCDCEKEPYGSLDFLINYPWYFELYEEAPKTRKVTYYRRKWVMIDNNYVASEMPWKPSKDAFDHCWKHLSIRQSNEWETMTIEVPNED